VDRRIREEEEDTGQLDRVSKIASGSAGFLTGGREQLPTSERAGRASRGGPPIPLRDVTPGADPAWGASPPSELPSRDSEACLPLQSARPWPPRSSSFLPPRSTKHRG
jgi:hypothetical protein